MSPKSHAEMAAEYQSAANDFRAQADRHRAASGAIDQLADGESNPTLRLELEGKASELRRLATESEQGAVRWDDHARRQGDLALEDARRALLEVAK